MWAPFVTRISATIGTRIAFFVFVRLTVIAWSRYRRGDIIRRKLSHVTIWTLARVSSPTSGHNGNSTRFDHVPPSVPWHEIGRVPDVLAYGGRVIEPRVYRPRYFQNRARLRRSSLG